MSSSPRVLRQPSIEDMPVRETHGPINSLEQVAADAYERGVAEGQALASAQMMAAAESIRIAIGAERDTLRAEFDRQRDVLIRTAVDIAEVVLGHANHDGGEAVAQRITRVMERMDDIKVTVTVHPDDLEAVMALRLGDVDLETDSRFSPGEAKVVGDWASADLTFAAALDVVRNRDV